MNVWWCNQRRDWDLERPAGVVCSTDQMENLTYRQTVAEVRAGDIVIHYRSPQIVAFSRAREDGKHHRALPLVSGEDYGSGWCFRTEYFDLASPVHKRKFAGSLLPIIKKHYPVDRNANMRQGYFFPFDVEGARVVLRSTNEPLPEWLSALLPDRVTDAHTAALKPDAAGGSSAGAGFGDAEQNARVEQAAIKLVTMRYRGAGWDVVSVEGQHLGFDLLCRRSGTEAHVEVKGVAGCKLTFMITAAELRRATDDDRFILAVVTDALSDRPVLMEWRGQEFHRRFTFEPVQYRATATAEQRSSSGRAKSARR